MDKRSVTQCILNMALAQTPEANGQRITDLYLVIGDHATSIGEALQLHWDTLSQGTLAEGARLHMESGTLMLRCSDCDHTFALPESSLKCPLCGSLAVAIVGGEGCRLEAIQYE